MHAEPTGRALGFTTSTKRGYDSVFAAGRDDLATRYNVGMKRKQQPTVEDIYPEFVESFPDVVSRIERHALQRHKTILGIKLLPADSERWQWPIPQIMQECGIVGFQNLLWDTTAVEPSYMEDEKEMMGGQTQFLVGPSGEHRAFIVVREPVLDDERLRHSRLIKCLGIMLHEIGHVDDFEKRINLIAGQPPNLTEAELYAHVFTCRQLQKNNLRLCLRLYLSVLEDLAKQEKVKCVAEAAKRFLSSAEAAQFQAFADREMGHEVAAAIERLIAKGMSPDEISKMVQ